MPKSLSRRSLILSALTAPSVLAQGDAMHAFHSNIDQLKERPGSLTNVRLNRLETLSTQAQMQRLVQMGLAANTVDDVNAPWEMFLYKLKDYVQGGDPKNVQMVTVPRSASWTENTYGPYRLCKVYGDSMPKWGATYEPALGNSFGDMYGIFLSNLVIPLPNPADQKKADVARKDWQKALAKIQSHKATIGDRWKQFDDRQQSLPPEDRMKFQEWYQEFEVPIIGSLQDDLNLRVQTYVSYVNKAGAGYGVVSQKINAFSQEAATFFTAAEGSGTSRLERVYRYTIGDNLDSWIQGAKTQPPDAIKWSFKSGSFRQTLNQTSWGGSGSYGLFFHGGASGGSSHLDWHSNSFSLIFTAKAVQRFDVIPGDWYAAELIKLFKGGRFVENGPIDVAYKSGTLWGDRGVFSLRLAGLIVVYEPAITVAMAKADYERNYSYWSGSAGIGIGPFSFGASAGGSREDITFNQTDNSVSAVDRTGVPKIAAIVTDVLPDLT